jgi:hypothetical protein
MQVIKSALFSLGLNVQEMKNSVVFQNRNITPSSACLSKHADEFQHLLEGLHMNIGSRLSLLATVQEATEPVFENNFTFSWKRPSATSGGGASATGGKGDSKEGESYAPLVDYLTTLGLKAVVVGSGQGLPNGHLFNQHVHTLKKDVTMRSGELRKTGDEPRYLYRLSGRTDVVVIAPEETVVSRQSVRVAIEVKPEYSLNKDESLREAFLQLIGLNAGNAIQSPVVILTDLVKTHYVLFLDASMPPLVKYSLKILKFSQINFALSEASKLSVRPCFTQHFGAPPTPQASETSIEGDVEGEAQEVAFGNAQIHK